MSDKGNKGFIMSDKGNKGNDTDALKMSELQKALDQMAAEIASLRQQNEALRVKASKRETLPEVESHAATAVMRALVCLGASGAQINRALGKGYDLFASPSGISTQIARAQAWVKAADKTVKAVKAFAPAPLTVEQAKTVCGHAGIAAPTATPSWFAK